MRRAAALVLVVGWLPLRLPAAEPLTVDIFTDAAHPVTTAALTRAGVPFAYYELDAPARWAAALSRDLPADPARAEALLQARLARLPTASLTSSWQSLARARQYGLDRLPAVVCRRPTAACWGVVYGVTDGAAALAHCRRGWDLQRP